MSKKERRPTHEFLSELSIYQKHKFTNQRQNLKIKLDRIDIQRRRSLDVIENERRLISASLKGQQDKETTRKLVRSSEKPVEEAPDRPLSELPRRNSTEVRSTSVDFSKQGRRLSTTLIPERIPRSAGTLRREKPEVHEIGQERSLSPDKVLALAQRRHSGTLGPEHGSFCARTTGKGFSVSQSSDEDVTVDRASHVQDAMMKRRMSMPVLFPSLSNCTKPNFTESFPKTVGNTSRNSARRHSFAGGQLQLPRRYSTKKMADTAVARMAGMHNVMQRTSMFQIQENEALDDLRRETART